MRIIIHSGNVLSCSAHLLVLKCEPRQGYALAKYLGHHTLKHCRSGRNVSFRTVIHACLESTHRGRDVSTPSSPVDVDVLALLVCGVGELRLDPEGVGTKVVTLRLEEVGRKVLGAVSVVEAERSAESGSGDTPESALGDDAVALLA